MSLPGSFSGLRLWLRADAGVSKDSADKVSGWADQSSSGNPASQASAAKQPLWISSALNGQPVLRFDPDALASYDVAARTIALIREEGAESFTFVGNDRFRNLD